MKLLAFVLAFGSVLTSVQSQPEMVADQDRSGPTRQARCRLGDEPVRPCRFTPLFGDGSFNIELSPDRAYRIVVDGERGFVFVVFGPERLVRVWQPYRRDRTDRACWVGDVQGDDPPGRICAY